MKSRFESVTELTGFSLLVVNELKFKLARFCLLPRNEKEYALDHSMWRRVEHPSLSLYSHHNIACSHLTHNRTLGCHLGIPDYLSLDRTNGDDLSRLLSPWGIFESPNQLVCRELCRLFEEWSWIHGDSAIEPVGTLKTQYNTPRLTGHDHHPANFILLHVSWGDLLNKRSRWRAGQVLTWNMREGGREREWMDVCGWVYYVMLCCFSIIMSPPTHWVGYCIV